MRELVITKKQEEKRIAYLKDGILKEYYKEEEDKKRLEGNIYAAKVENVFPGMQAAFIDIGEEKNAFLHIKDVLPKKSSITGNKQENLDEYKIKDYIKTNQMLLVQVKKDSTNIKGARVSTNIQIAGRFVILLPENDFITVSQKIEDNNEKERLIEIVKRYKQQKKLGIIIRTAANKKDENILIKDIEQTIQKLEKLQEKYEKVKKENKPIILQKSNTILEKILLDLADNMIDKIWVNEKDLKQQVEEILNKNGQEKNIEIEVQEKDLENKYDLENQVIKIENRKIWLKCGGFITIEKTEALTAIDVNSRKIHRKRRFRTNCFKSK